MSVDRIQKQNQIVGEYVCPFDGEVLKDDSVASHYRTFSVIILWKNEVRKKSGWTEKFPLLMDGFFVSLNYWRNIRRKHKNIKFDHESEVKKLCRKVEVIKTSRKDWKMIENEALIGQLIRHWAVSSSPVVIMGPPGVGKSLGELFSFFKWSLADFRLKFNRSGTNKFEFFRDFH